MLRSAMRVAVEWHWRLTARQDASGRKGEDAARQQRAHLQRSAGITQTVRTEVLQRFMNNPGKNALAVHNGSQACPQTEKTRGNASQPAETTGRLPRAVVKVRVPRGPGAVEGERQLLVVLVLLTPHPEGGEHLSLHKAKKEVRIGPRLRQGPTPIHGTGSARACSAGSPACGDPQRRGLATPCPHCKHVAEPKTQGGRRKDSPKANTQEPHGPVSPVVSDPRATRPRP